MVSGTVVTIVGNALNTPEFKRTNGNTIVTNFKIASTSRRFDKARGRWVDGASLRVRVTCWRQLGDNVASSVLGGDPLVVTGTMYTRDWIGNDGQHHVSYELEASAVGHNLARGKSRFIRQRPNLSTTMIDDEPVALDQKTSSGIGPANTGYGDSTEQWAEEPQEDGWANGVQPDGWPVGTRPAPPAAGSVDGSEFEGPGCDDSADYGFGALGQIRDGGPVSDDLGDEDDLLGDDSTEEVAAAMLDSAGFTLESLHKEPGSPEPNSVAVPIG